MKFIILSESLASAKAKYGELADDLEDIDPTPTKKYLEFLCKTNEEILDAYNGTQDEDVAYDIVGDALEKFTKISKELPKKDINQYETYEEFLSAVEKYSTQKDKRNPIKKIHPESKVIFENNEVIVIRVDSWEASQQYGAGKFCIAQTDNDGYWQEGIDDGIIYFYMFKKNNIHRPYVMEMWWNDNTDNDNPIKLVGWNYLDERIDADDLLDEFELDRKLFERQVDDPKVNSKMFN